MPYRIFQYPLPAPPLLEDLNTYLAAHRVVAVEQQMVPVAGGTLLVFIVQTVAGSPLEGTVRSGGGKPDFRQLLSPTEFTLFDRLRQERKSWAEAEGVPVYTIFSNAQLAEMVQSRASTQADLAKIEGVGPARLEKYGDRLLELLQALAVPPSDPPRPPPPPEAVL